ncbi:MAG: glycosyltransferase family 39 protein [Mastigocoleus sp. MO_167.B18]|nr:glycosyltransferase family 39 protein [Mastigocoleus sp. MO_167.B18]
MSEFNISRRLPQRQLFTLIISLLVLGIFFRFTNLDHKVYWHDEVYTSMRSSGYTGSEVHQEVFDGSVIGVEDLQKYQRLSSKKDLSNTIDALTKNPEHPPLYYLMMRFWMQLFGSSVTATRSLSAVISLLVFPSIYWLSLELFQSSLVGWVAVAIFTISPFHVLYAQEARQYSLWTVTILLSSASLLRAIGQTKHQNTQLPIFPWGMYALTLALSFYTALFSGFVAVGHGIYVFATQRCRITKTVIAYILASITGVIAFAPWIFIIVNNFTRLQEKTQWTTMQAPVSFLFKMWGLHLSCIFIDFGLDIKHPFTYLVPPLLLLMVIYSIYFLCSYTTKSVWLFVLVLIIFTPSCLIVPDLIWGGLRSAASRYFVPCYIGIILSVAYLFATKISGIRQTKKIKYPTILQILPAKIRRLATPTTARFTYWKLSLLKRKLWQGIMLVLISGAVTSCIVSSQAETWWNKTLDYHNHHIARIINQGTLPLVVGETYNVRTGNIISLSYSLEPKVKFQLINNPKVQKIADGFSDIFFVRYPTEDFQRILQKEYTAKVEMVENPYKAPLWKLVR